MKTLPTLSDRCCEDPTPYFNYNHWHIDSSMFFGICCTCGSILCKRAWCRCFLLPGEVTILLARRHPELYEELTDYSRATRLVNTRVTLCEGIAKRFTLPDLNAKPQGRKAAKKPPRVSASLRLCVDFFGACGLLLLRFTTLIRRIIGTTRPRTTAAEPAPHRRAAR